MIPMIEFLEPGRLWWLVLIPIVLLAYVAMLGRRTMQNRRPEHSRLDLVLPRESRWKRHFAVGMAVLSLAALVFAYARPKGVTEVPRERATVVVVIDVSKSMLATDVAPNRLDAAKQAGQEFVGMLPEGFNVSVVAFAGTATMIVPPTTDKARAQAAIASLQVAPSTAIGEGIYTGLDALTLVPPDPKHPDEPVPAAMVLLSDGKTNIGRSSLMAARAAKAKGCPISTIAYGTPNGWIEEDGRRVRVEVDYAELASVARESGGERYDARSLEDLKKIYQGIARSIGYEKVDKEITSQYIGWGLLCAVLASLGVISIAARWP